LGYRFTVEDEDMEKGVEEENDVWFYRDAVKQDRLGLDIKRVGHESGLDHDQRVVDVFFIEYMSATAPFQHSNMSPHGGWYIPIERGLIGTVVKYLQELTPPKMKHELRINAEVIRQPEADRVLLSVVCKLLT